MISAEMIRQMCDIFCFFRHERPARMQIQINAMIHERHSRIHIFAANFSSLTCLGAYFIICRDSSGPRHIFPSDVIIQKGEAYSGIILFLSEFQRQFNAYASHIAEMNVRMFANAAMSRMEQQYISVILCGAGIRRLIFPAQEKDRVLIVILRFAAGIPNESILDSEAYTNDRIKQ